MSTPVHSRPESMMEEAYVPPPAEVIFGRSQRMHQVRLTLERLGETGVPVLITGESGTGKEVMARLLHRHSRWAEGPFLKVNCAAIPSTLLESELFGFERGAFTGAQAGKPGRISQADGGSLFLDEIGELELALQAKLLQVLQDRRFMRLGGTREVLVRARMLFATNRNLQAEVSAGRFRQDLYYRINVVGIELPPLRERRADIQILARYFLQQFSRRFDRPEVMLTAELLAALNAYAWPGNVRELENLMKRLVVLGSDREILEAVRARPVPDPAPVTGLGEDGGLPLKSVTRRAVQDFERDIILRALEAHQWNRKRTAQALRISYRALLYKLKDAGLQRRASGQSEKDNV